jgi:mannose-6-phosphate isomerase class I
MTAFILDPGNFTPQQRTPWAGRWIWEKLKQHLPGIKTQKEIGEAWEFSFDQAFPSKVKGSGQILSDVLGPVARAVFGKAEFERVGCFSEILVKVIHAARPLSVQVHPDDDYPGLTEKECGKPESWLVLEAKDGAGVYLGFSESISKNNLRELLDQGQSIDKWLQFVPVKKGDYFELGPGVVHALGPDVLILEPQRIRPEKSGKTYRLYDWGVRYNHDGLPDPNGQPRELHVSQGLDQFDPSVQVGKVFLDTVKKDPKIRILNSGMKLFEYPGNPDYQIFSLESDGGKVQAIDRKEGYLVVYVRDGSLKMTDRSGSEFRMLRGETMLVGEDSFPGMFHLNGDICLVFSRGSEPLLL